MNALTALLEIAGEPLAAGDVAGEADNPLAQEHLDLIAQRNGFAAYENSLIVRPVGGPLDVVAWNSAGGWREGYAELGAGLFFFAEDAFGRQFGLDGHHVVAFDPETGERTEIAHSIEEWAKLMQSDHGIMTGHPLVAEWSAKYGELALGTKLLPRVPLIAGGRFEVANLVQVTDHVRMHYGGMLARHIANLGDGATFTLPYQPPTPAF